MTIQQFPVELNNLKKARDTYLRIGIYKIRIN